MPAVNELKTWLPLGSAQLIDWKHLGRSASARGATAWATRIGSEPVLMRTWCNESTTFYEFFYLGHEAVAGSIVVATNRPEQTRLQVKVTAEVEGRLSYAEITELREHSRTGLYGVTSRTMDGRLTPDSLPTLSPGHAEIFEYAPESALSTVCGTWLHELLGWVFETVTSGDSDDVPVAPAVDIPMPVESARPAAAVPASNASPRPVFTPPEPPPPPPADPLPPPRPAAPVSPAAAASPDSLVATTTTGDRWEVNAPETYMGRSKQCSIVLKSQRVSRKHASITREDDGFYINDLGAANGIWAGTDKIERERIEDGSEYIIGDVLVSFAFA